VVPLVDRVVPVDPVVDPVVPVDEDD